MSTLHSTNAVIETATDWTDADWDYFVVSIRNLLHKQSVKIRFTKKDGTNRIMNCTLSPSILPVIQESTSDKPIRKQSENSIAVYDIDVSAWRSFTYRSVLSVEYQLD